jgi:hypothetical protein
MKKTLALVVLTILCALVAGTIPALAQSTNATLNSVCRSGTLYFERCDAARYENPGLITTASVVAGREF